MLNQWVLHRRYSVGQIIAVEGDLVTVRFSQWVKVLGLTQAISQGVLTLLDPKAEQAFLAQHSSTPAKQPGQPHNQQKAAANSFTVGQTYANAEINAQFSGQTSGRIRRSESGLVLIAEADDQPNAQGQFLFSGVGTTGDQSLTKAPNKTLANAGDTLLYVFAPAPHRAYTYLGEARCVADPIAVTQVDRQGNDRKAWQFPLQFN